ncbi:uncharacterized protein LOC120325796 [Styela clava]
MMQFLNLDALKSLLILHAVYVATFSLETHESCSQKCAKQVLTLRDIKYETCMKTCLNSYGYDWPLKNEANCEMSVEVDSSPACSARNMRVLSSPVNVTGYTAGTIAKREFIVVVWTPCPYGIDDVNGYEVKLLEKNMFGYEFCKKVVLSRKLNSSEIKKDISVMFDDQELDYGANYEISVEGLPKTVHRHHAYITYTSMTCAELNGIGSCECGLEGFDSPPGVDAHVEGYHVNVLLTVLNKCFKVYKYQLSLLYSGNHTEALATFDLVPQHNASKLEHTFHSVYPTDTSSGSLMFLQYHAFSKDGSSKVSCRTEFSVSEWIPKVFYISAEKNTINVTWKCAPENFNITKYEIQLNWYGLHSNSQIKYRTIHPVNKHCFSPYYISKVLLSVRPGIYSTQVREWRPSSVFYLPPKWSPLSRTISVDFKEEKNFMNENDLVISASIVFPLIIIIFLVLGILFLMRKGYCKKIHHNLPFAVDRFSGPEETFHHVSKSVWLVWQADYSNSAIGNLHAENIRHLATFLANHCGLNVLLDQFEISSSMGYSAWIQEKYQTADITIFVCPHRSIFEPEPLHTNRIGNFSAVFRFYEASLLRDENLSKFATVLLPYSKTDACRASKLLLKTTSVFRLMDEIESLYFFIQGCAKVTRLGRYVVKYINDIDYTQTSEGVALKNGIDNILKLFNSGENDILPATSQNIPNASIPEDSTTPLIKDVESNVIDVVSPSSTSENQFLNKTRRFKPCPPPPVLDDEDADESVFLINTNELLSLQPLTNEAIEPVTCETYCSLFAPSPPLA